MCELLGMECNVPTDIVFSFSGFALRGGMRGPHADGWGLALYEGRSVRTFLEPAPAAKSALAAYIRSNPIKTLLAIAHVRRRTWAMASSVMIGLPRMYAARGEFAAGAGSRNVRTERPS